MSKLITIEGGEGVGKTTLIKGLKEFLYSKNIDSFLTSEPGGSPSANLIRKVFTHPDISDPLTKKTELLLVSAARSQHISFLKKNYLSKGIWVICDRFADSSRVYQGILGEIPDEHLEPMIDFSTSGIAPDLTLLLDCPIELSMKRAQSDISTSRSNQGAVRYDFASNELYSKIRQGFLKIKDKYPSRIKLIDASKDSKFVLDQSIDILEKYLFNA